MFSPTISTFIAIVNECNWNSNLRPSLTPCDDAEKSADPRL